MKKYLKYICSIGLVFLLMLSLCFTSFASVQSLMIRTNSNAMTTFNLPRSSIASVTNTVDWDLSGKPIIRFTTINKNTGGTVYHWIQPELDADGLWIEWTAPDNYYINRMNLYLVYDGIYTNCPPVGTYNVQIDYSSYFSNDLTSLRLFSTRAVENAQAEEKQENLNFTETSGDIYSGVFNLSIPSGLERAGFALTFSQSANVVNIAYLIKVNFVASSVGEDNYTFITSPASGSDIEANYQNNVSSSLSDISSSVDDLGEGISGVTEAIQNLQGAMEPHYSNVLTQLHHITEQLHAFYDQIYNNIHLKEYALWQDIKTAIENIDLEVNVNLDKLKTSIDNMSTAIQNKLQSVTDTITGGFDNSGIEQNGNELDSSITEFEEAEQNVLESVNDSLNDFEFDADLSEYKNIVQVISDFLQELYDSSGGFKLVINLSLMLSVASIVIGVYRFKEGG